MAHPPLQPTDITHGHRATPISFVQAIVDAYARYRADPARALSASGIEPALLCDPQARITARQLETISSIAMQELDDEALGWFSRKLRWGSYGMLCRASLTSPNLGVALKRWCRHHGLLIDDLELTLTVTPSSARIAIVEHCDLGSMREFCLLTSLRYVLGYACWAIDARIPCLSVTLPIAAPAHHDVYPLLFDGDIAFDAREASLSFDAQYLSAKLRRDEPALRRMLERALPLTVLQYRKDRLLAQRVHQLLSAQPDERLTAERLAERLYMSTRTLHRQLKEEGASLQRIKDDVRRNRAIHLLTRTQRPIKQIAIACGYHNEKSFTRAFQRWTGQPPSGLRQHGVP